MSEATIISDTGAAVADDATVAAIGEVQPALELESGNVGWREGLDSAIKDHPALVDLADVPSLAKSYLATKEMVGRKGIIPPKADDPADRDRFFNELGRPTTADGYELSGFQPPEGLPWSEEFQTAMLPKLHAAGLTNDQARQVFQDYADVSMHQYASMMETANQGRETTEAALRTELGAAYAESVERSKVAFRELAGENYEEVAALMLADGTPLGNHPAFVRTFLNAANSIREDTTGGEKVGISHRKTPEQALQELRELEANPALWNEGPEQKILQQRRNELSHDAFLEPTPEVLR